MMLPDAIEQILDARHGAVEEVGADPVKLADRASVTGMVAETLVELVKRDRSPLDSPIRHRLLEQFDELVPRDGGIGADRRQHTLVRELDDGVAEVEEEAGFWHGLEVARLRGRAAPRNPETARPRNYIRNTPNLGSSILALYAIDRPRPRYVRVSAGSMTPSSQRRAVE